jgi:alpha-L-arabinofuranosidase
MRNLVLLTLTLAALCTRTLVGAATIQVQVDKPGHQISSNLWGIFFEDINCSADGGVYGELVRNRSFEDYDQPEHWSLLTHGDSVARLSIATNSSVMVNSAQARNGRYARLEVTAVSGESRVDLVNDGYWGIAVREGAKYELSFCARAQNELQGPLDFMLQGGDGKTYARTSLRRLSRDWKQYRLTLNSSGDDAKARLVISTAKKGILNIDMVSLFPRDTWKHHGLRSGLMSMLDELKPSFVRFPGGCWVEGDWMRLAYRWKETIGEPIGRRTQWNIWNYWATHGVGFHEYLQMCEDLGAQPLFVINCGMAHHDNVPSEQLAPYVQDALDALEYCNGSTSTPYGAIRAKNGHPAPFNLKLMEIGNENGGRVYYTHWAAFHRAIKAKDPNVTLIANEWAGGHPQNVPPEIVDEHYYDSPEFFMSHANQYDSRDRRVPKVYIGEYAVTRGCGQGNLRAAIGEAAFMTGIERNSDLVLMASYAPLFANVNYKRWNPDLICYDSSRQYGLPSYYVQKLFSQNRGDVVLPVRVNSPSSRFATTGGAIGVGTWKTRAEFKDIKVIVADKTIFTSDFSSNSEGWRRLGEGQWSVTNGAFCQSSLAENVRAIAGDKSWKNYTLSLKARKLGGDEGFLILFNVQNAEEKSWWNIGGWGNTRHAIEMGGLNSHDVNGSVETGRWYDIRIETSDTRVKCYLDNQLVHDAAYPELSSLYASASRELRSRDIIVKVVNGSSETLQTELQLEGITGLDCSARATVLTSANGEDENSLEQPNKVAPKDQSFKVQNSAIRASFPGNSLTVIRIPTGKS